LSNTHTCALGMGFKLVLYNESKHNILTVVGKANKKISLLTLTLSVNETSFSGKNALNGWSHNVHHNCSGVLWLLLWTKIPIVLHMHLILAQIKLHSWKPGKSSNKIRQRTWQHNVIRPATRKPLRHTREYVKQHVV
jgi:hypothetical protein